jgi:GDP-L-fucose synthase
MKVLVFGSNGLVGNAIKRYSGLNENTRKYNFYFSTRRDTNLFSYDETYKLISEFKPEILINAAAKVGGIVANNTNRTDFIIDNVKINLNILEASKQIKPFTLINLGSSCIYPLNAKNPISESSIMTGKLEPTNSPYAQAKLMSIEMANSISQEYGHKVINLMPTNLYGPNDNFDRLNSHVIPGLIGRMFDAKKEKNDFFEIWGSGTALREFLYVDDLADAIFFLLESKKNESLLNVGSGEEVSILQLAEKIRDLVEFKGDFKFDLTQPDGNNRKLLNLSKINSIGWKSKTDLDTGLKKTISWYRDNLL